MFFEMVFWGSFYIIGELSCNWLHVIWNLTLFGRNKLILVKINEFRVDQERLFWRALRFFRSYNLFRLHENQSFLLVLRKIRTYHIIPRFINIVRFDFVTELLESLRFASFKDDSGDLAPFLFRRGSLAWAQSALVEVLKFHVIFILF